MAPMDVTFGSEQGPSGKGEVRVLKNEIKIVAEDGTIYPIALDHVADGVKVVAGQDLYFKLNRNQDWLYNLRPWEGNYFGRFKWFPHAKDEEPKAYLRKGGKRKGRGGGFYVAPDRLKFTAEFEIVAGPYEGMVGKKAYDYLWEPGEEGEARLRVVGEAGERLYDFMRHTGFDFTADGVPYSDNILPALEAILQGRSKTVMLSIKEGWIDSISAVPDGVVPPTKKAAAKRTPRKKKSE